MNNEEKGETEEVSKRKDGMQDRLGRKYHSMVLVLRLPGMDDIHKSRNGKHEQYSM